MKQSLNIRIRGIVQGVGFRPFVFQLERRHRITGRVLNNTEGVVIHADGRTLRLRPTPDAMRERAFEDPAARRKLEAILHPR